jgi:hypothetical protein
MIDAVVRIDADPIAWNIFLEGGKDRRRRKDRRRTDERRTDWVRVSDWGSVWREFIDPEQSLSK